MRELPILYSFPMVEAIIAGRKKKTRRTRGLAAINKTPDIWVPRIFDNIDPARESYGVYHYQNNQGGQRVGFDVGGDPFEGPSEYVDCPYGKKGDLLWTKETFTILDYWEESEAVQIMYEDGSTRVVKLTQPEWDKFIKWQDKYARKSSLFMFKSLSRIWQQVEKVKIERVQDINEDEATAEGLQAFDDWSYIPGEAVMQPEEHHSAYSQFMRLWQSLNGPESWTKNPWVWVISFKILSTTGKPTL